MLRSLFVPAFVVALAGSVALVACSRESRPTPEAQAPSAPAATAPAEAKPAAAPDDAAPGDAGDGAEGAAGKARVDADNYTVSLKARGPYSSGKGATIEVVLVAKGEFKVNKEYPVRFRLSSANGLDAPEVIKKDKATIEKKKLVLPVAFTPESAGKKTLGGTLHFSVCTDDKCLMEKQDLSLEIDVK